MAEKTLPGARVAILVADGFEQIEVTEPLKRLRSEGADPRIVSLRHGSIRGMNFTAPGKKLRVDQTVFDAAAEDYDALFVPGGFVNPDLLRQSERALELVRDFDKAKKPIAFLCHGAEVLISAGLVSGRTLTSWPGIADDVKNAGGQWLDRPVVRDANWVSSRSPEDLRMFNDAMVQLFGSRLARREPMRRWPRAVGAVIGVAGAALAIRKLIRG
jgi:protease I